MERGHEKLGEDRSFLQYHDDESQTEPKHTCVILSLDYLPLSTHRNC